MTRAPFLLGCLAACLAGCSFPTKHLATGDAGNTDTRNGDSRTDGSVLDARAGFECAGQPFPTTAPAIIHFSGQILDGMTGQPVPSYQFQMLDAQDNPLGMGASDANGNFSVASTTGGAPVDAHFRTNTMPTYVGSLTYAPHPVVADAPSSGIELFSFSAMAQIANACGMNYNGNQGALFVATSDCNAAALAGVKVSLSDANLVPCYNGGSGMTDASGLALFFNLTPGPTTVNAVTMDGIDLYPRDVEIQPQYLTVVGLEPGP